MPPYSVNDMVGDKRETRWIRNLRTIRIVNLIDLSLRDGSKPANGARP
jgi:hypothetical protein